MAKRRNPVVRTAAILRKGGAHTKSVSGGRHRQKLRITNAIDEWYEEADDQHDASPPPEASNNHKPDVRKNNGNRKKKGQSNTAPFHFRHAVPKPSMICVSQLQGV